MGLADLVTPVTSADWKDRQLSEDDSTTDGSGDFLAALHAQTNVSIVVSDSHEGLETSTLTGTGLFLYRHDLEHLIVERGPRKKSIISNSLMGRE